MASALSLPVPADDMLINPNINENNILAKKSDFANAIDKDQIEISQESWNNFRHIFDKIDTIINL